MKTTKVMAKVTGGGEGKRWMEMDGYDLGSFVFYRPIKEDGKQGKKGWVLAHAATGCAFGCNMDVYKDALELCQLLAKHADPEKVASEDQDRAADAVCEAGAKAYVEYAKHPRRPRVLERLQRLTDKYTQKILGV